MLHIKSVNAALERNQSCRRCRYQSESICLRLSIQLQWLPPQATAQRTGVPWGSAEARGRWLRSIQGSKEAQGGSSVPLALASSLPFCCWLLQASGCSPKIPMPNQLPNIHIALGFRREAFWYPRLDLKQPLHLTSPHSRQCTHVPADSFSHKPGAKTLSSSLNVS